MQKDLRVKHTLEEIHFTFFKVNLNSFKTCLHSQAQIRASHKRVNCGPPCMCLRLVVHQDKDHLLPLVAALNFH